MRCGIEAASGGRMIEKQIAVAVKEHCGGVDGLMGFFLEAADTER